VNTLSTVDGNVTDELYCPYCGSGNENIISSGTSTTVHKVDPNLTLTWTKALQRVVAKKIQQQAQEQSSLMQSNQSHQPTEEHNVISEHTAEPKEEIR
jgi:hypothetical protein